MFANYEKINDFLRDEIRKHKEVLDPSDPQDYIDNYLLEIEKVGLKLFTFFKMLFMHWYIVWFLKNLIKIQ